MTLAAHLAHFARLQARLARLVERAEQAQAAEARWRPPDRFTFEQEQQLEAWLQAARAE